MKSERRIQSLLRDYPPSPLLAVPNFRPPDWYECDLAVITQRMRLVEYEIKVSESDFQSDARKKVKHEKLHAGVRTGPTRFYYVARRGIIHKDDVPAHAGLLVVEKNWDLECRKEAPLLHDTPVEKGVIERAYRACHTGLWAAMEELLNAIDSARYDLWSAQRHLEDFA